MKAQILFFTAAAAFSTGCASYTYHAPIVGQDSDGNAMAGQFSVNNQSGSFWVQSPRGARCSGTYDPHNNMPTIIEKVRCNDGRTGEAVITRQGLSGTAIAEFDDGTRAQYVFGNMSYEQAFGNGGAAKTADIRGYVRTQN